MTSKAVIKTDITNIYNRAVADTRNYMNNAISARMNECKAEIEEKNSRVLQNYNTTLNEIATAEMAEINAIKAKYDAVRKRAVQDRDYAYTKVRSEIEAKIKESLNEFAPYIEGLNTAGKTLQSVVVAE